MARSRLGRVGKFVRTETLGRVGESIERRREFQAELKKARKKLIPKIAEEKVQRELIERPRLKEQIRNRRILSASRRASRTATSTSRLGVGLDLDRGFEFISGTPRRPVVKIRKIRKKQRKKKSGKGKTITLRFQ